MTVTHAPVRGARDAEAPYPSAPLIVPALSEEMVDKAFAACPTTIGLDLEDALPDRLKATGRQVVQAAVRRYGVEGGRPVFVRVNPVATREWLRDAESLLEDGAAAPAGLILPKLEHPRDAEIVRAVLGAKAPGIEVWALVETPLGIENATDICRSGAVDGVILGVADLVARTHARRTWHDLLYARSRLVNAARSAGVAAFDSPFFALEDHEGLAAEARAAYELGFTGKAAVHPAQIRVIDAAFRPTDDELAGAQALLDDAGDGVGRVGGRMVGPPLLAEARNIAARAGTAEDR